MAILDEKVLVEFDGPNHKLDEQMEIDKRKNKLALDSGFLIVRRRVRRMAVISPDTIEGLIERE